MKILYKSSLASLIAMVWLLASCSPEYGAHFAPSKQGPSVAAKQETKLVAPTMAAKTVEKPAITERAEAAGASEVTTDATPAVSKELPLVNTKKQQRKVLRDLKQKIKGMSEQERQLFKDQVQRQLQEQQLSLKMAADEQGEPRGANGVSTALLVILAILIPPLAVFLHQGEINSKFWISLVLTILFFVPGVVYSLLVVLDVV